MAPRASGAAADRPHPEGLHQLPADLSVARPLHQGGRGPGTRRERAGRCRGDAGYRGELIVLLVNTDPSSAFLVERGDRIAQLVIQKVEHVAFDVVYYLDETERAVGG